MATPPSEIWAERCAETGLAHVADPHAPGLGPARGAGGWRG